MIHAPATLRRLTIALDQRAGREGAETWRFGRETGLDPAQALVGRTPQEAARLAPLVFNLCGAAHSFAAATALGLPAAADGAADGVTMARETVRDHALAMLHAWPQALGEAPDRAALGLLARPGRTEDFATALVGQGADLPSFSPAELDAWLAEAPTATARLLARLRRDTDPAEGRAGLPELTVQDVATALDPARASIAGGLRETGALGRVARTPLVAALLVREGPSLFVRLLARLVDCLVALKPAPLSTDDLPPGLGIAPAARGLLGHGARVEAGRVAAYRILSPSAWNLAPGGLLERAFAALTPGPGVRRLAPLLVSAINPCVPVTLSFAEEPAHA
ncbi:nickel-dependent hydrogenase large subunit [Xanthobacter oligotrophicus]|uniref:nickel-dependent hydrogenase large subunit n=1 Tax=Xanthobacter oligotrophicus TaxID=2607286 RepID=UPI0011F15AB2|nr:nickel-dependent hydrogenase large subunit [Xanthobacter oligotrophicus]MCG5234792.1 nickel-dependent hydrogenase large subunit [Xanthobacter oligotrophicus]